MGVVIGETAEVGDDVTLYQGVTLGGTSLKREKRHPTLERDVVVGTGAAVMGALRVGEGARIGAGSVVVAEVPPNSVVVGVPGKVIYRDGKRVAPRIDLEHADLPDPADQGDRADARPHPRAGVRGPVAPARARPAGGARHAPVIRALARGRPRMSSGGSPSTCRETRARRPAGTDRRPRGGRARGRGPRA